MDSYNNTIDYLYSLQKYGIKLGLDNINKLMQILGNPHNSFRAIHVAGTNGKGSTAAAIASVLHSGGFRTGLFTSPHLISFTERISINQKRITEEDVMNISSKIREKLSGADINPTFFEFVTAMAFYYFSIHKVELAVIETGLGGRLDSTNVVKPVITLITNISLDHCEFLGDSIAEITYEKAGIIKDNTPVLSASLDPDVISRLTEIARQHNAEAHFFGRDFNGTLKNMNANRIIIDYSGDNKINDISVPVTGRYQLYNICLAIRTCELLMNKGVSLSVDSIIAGLQKISLEGRLEHVSHNPLIVIDGAHNPAAAASLSESITSIYPDKKIILIAGIMADKNIHGILHPLFKIAESVILTKAAYERAAPPDRLREIISDITNSGNVPETSNIIITGSVKEALTVAKSRYTENSIIIISGSFYTTGEAKELLGFKGVLSRLRE